MATGGIQHVLDVLCGDTAKESVLLQGRSAWALHPLRTIRTPDSHEEPVRAGSYPWGGHAAGHAATHPALAIHKRMVFTMAAPGS